ncbi:Mechanosensitive ion channel protein 9, partial [Bienertia sinuspersici]
MDSDYCLFHNVVASHWVSNHKSSSPLDVGNLSAVDGNMMEVKTIGVWKTTFAKVGTQEEIMYPNSELSNKNIINYKTDFDWNDNVELDIASLDEEKITIIKQEVEQHNVNLKNSTYFECLKEKRKQRSEFVLHAQSLVNHTKNGGLQTS